MAEFYNGTRGFFDLGATGRTPSRNGGGLDSPGGPNGQRNMFATQGLRPGLFSVVTLGLKPLVLWLSPNHFVRVPGPTGYTHFTFHHSRCLLPRSGWLR